jgi:hypothetical protein
MVKKIECDECLDRSCENPYNEDGECWTPQSLLNAVASGSEKIVNVILKIQKPWWVRFPWADSINEVWDELDDESRKNED